MHVNLPGVRLWFTDTGGSGVPIVLLHANSGTSANWQAQINAFSAAGYRVIAFDRRGWGQSFTEPSTGAQPGTVAEDLERLIEHLKLGKFHLLGVAGGGFIALDYAAWKQERLLSLIIGASTGAMSDPPEVAFRERILFPGFRALPPEYRELGPSYLGENPEGVKQWIAIEHKARHAADSWAPPLRSPNTYFKISRIRTPALLIMAGADLLAPPALMRQWGAHLPNAEYAEVFDAGHSIAWERPELFNNCALQFLRRLPGSASSSS